MDDPLINSRFWSKVDASGDCWIWTGSINPVNGYSHTYWGGHTNSGHRAAYEMLVGPIPEGLQLDHLCRVRACVNPDHLEPVTARENVRRSPSALIARFGTRTHCSAGHEYTEANTLIRHQAKGVFRQCRECSRTYSKRAYTKRRTAA